MGQPVADERLLVDVPATLTVTLLDGYGEPAAANGTVTVDILSGDGSTLVTGGSASPVAEQTGVYAYTLAAAANTDLQLLTAVWSDDGTVRRTTRHEITAGFFFSLAEVEATEPGIGDITDGGAKQRKARRVRDEVERECERITGTAWVRRYARVRVDGSGTTRLLMRDGIYNPRSVRTVRVYTTATQYTAFTADEIAAVHCTEWGDLIRLDGAAWPAGRQNIVIELEHGYDRPPDDLRRAAITRFKQRYVRDKVIDLEAFSRFQLPDGGVVDVGDIEFEVEQRNVLRVYRAYAKRTAL